MTTFYIVFLYFVRILVLKKCTQLRSPEVHTRVHMMQHTRAHEHMLPGKEIGVLRTRCQLKHLHTRAQCPISLHVCCYTRGSTYIAHEKWFWFPPDPPPAHFSPFSLPFFLFGLVEKGWIGSKLPLVSRKGRGMLVEKLLVHTHARVHAGVHISYSFVHHAGVPAMCAHDAHMHVCRCVTHTHMCAQGPCHRGAIRPSSPFDANLLRLTDLLQHTHTFCAATRVSCADAHTICATTRTYHVRIRASCYVQTKRGVWATSQVKQLRTVVAKHKFLSATSTRIVATNDAKRRSFWECSSIALVFNTSSRHCCIQSKRGGVATHFDTQN